MKSKHISTRLLHTPYTRNDTHGSLRMPIYDSVAYGFNSAENLEATFKGQQPGHVYSRIANPTVEHLENQIAQITEANGVLALGSGMAAISSLILAIAGEGDNIITSKKIFGNSYSLFAETLAGLGIDFRFADLTNSESVKSKIDERTCALFFETITNPHMEVADIAKLSEISHQHNLILIADSTLTPPCIFQSKNFGVDVEVISSTKFLSGGATSIGGLIIDNGTYNWDFNHKLKSYAKQFGPQALIARLRKEVARNMGPTLSAHNAYLQSLGLETLTLRVDKACRNTMEIAQWLESRKEVKQVNYPGLASSSFHTVSLQQFGKFPGAVLAFDLETRKACFNFINKMQMIRIATNMNDNKTLIIHPASTIFCEYDEATLKQLDIRQTSIRLSVGIEEPEDIIEDLKNGLGQLP
ncbi:MAG: aminotransferase class I/II-fold pyridoxal phosphate-dependent enzyme [Bacteroidota bacterium]